MDPCIPFRRVGRQWVHAKPRLGFIEQCRQIFAAKPPEGSPELPTGKAFFAIGNQSVIIGGDSVQKLRILDLNEESGGNPSHGATKIPEGIQSSLGELGIVDSFQSIAAALHDSVWDGESCPIGGGMVGWKEHDGSQPRYATFVSSCEECRIRSTDLSIRFEAGYPAKRLIQFVEGRFHCFRLSSLDSLAHPR